MSSWRKSELERFKWVRGTGTTKVLINPCPRCKHDHAFDDVVADVEIPDAPEGRVLEAAGFRARLRRVLTDARQMTDAGQSEEADESEEADQKEEADQRFVWVECSCGQHNGAGCGREGNVRLTEGES